MNAKDIRWRQRFENFQKALHPLQKTAAITPLSEIERAALIHFFEIAFELAWKTLKDLLEAERITAKTPRAVIKESFAIDLLPDGALWLRMLDDRNVMAHTYDEATSIKITTTIQESYVPELLRLHALLTKKV